MKKLFVLVILLAAAGSAAYFYIPHSDKLEITQPTRGPAVQAVYATGTVEPSVMIPIAPRSTARLIGLEADEGLQVAKDDVLAQLEDTDLKNTLTELQAKANLASKELARKTGLYQRKATSEQDVDQAKAARDAAAAAVARAKTEISYLKLLAPESGIIIRRDGEVGEMIAANQPVFWMSCCKPLRIASEVDEEDISLVTPGKKVLISADAFPGKIFNGTVLSITPKGDPVARSYRVRISLEGVTPLMIGMTAETNIIITEKKDALLVPASAVHDGKIWTVAGNKLHEADVETGAKTDDAVEIISGLDDSAVVVMNPRRDLSEGQSVETVTRTWQAR
jgi:multidrug efflux system membrane fusion protein